MKGNKFKVGDKVKLFGAFKGEIFGKTIAFNDEYEYAVKYKDSYDNLRTIIVFEGDLKLRRD